MQIDYRTIRTGEEIAAADIVNAAFEQYVAPGWSEAGLAEFRRYAHADSIRARRSAGPHHDQLVAIAPAGMSHDEGTVTADTIVGIGELREWQHLSMLFVHPDWLRLGIGTALFLRLRAIATRENPNLSLLTVNSSPFAVPIYERLGFEIADEPRTISGIVHIPMTLDLRG